MYVKSIHLKNFKRFAKLDLEFPGDITVVKGPNERGKSTLVEAMIAALFYDPQKSSKKLEELKSWGADKGYSIKLVFEEDGQAYELTKDFNGKTASLINRDTGELWNDMKEIEEILFRFGGYRNEKLFVATAFVKQDSLQDVVSGKKELSQALEDLISSGAGGQSVSEIIKRTDARIDELLRGLEHPSKNPGIIKELTERRLQKREELSGAKSKLASIQGKEQKLKEKDAAYQKLISELELKKSHLKDIDSYFSFFQKSKELDKRIDEISRDMEEVEKLDKDYNFLVQELKTHTIHENDAKEIHAISREIEVQELRLREMQKDARPFVKGLKGKHEETVSPYLIGILLLFSVLGLGGFFISAWFFAGWIVAAAVALLVFFYPHLTRRKGSRDLEKVIAREEKRLSYLNAALGDVFGRLGATTLQEADEKIRQLKDTSDRAQSIKSKMEGMLRGRTVDGLREGKRKLEKSFALEEARVRGELLSNPPTSEDKKRVERSVLELEKEREKLSEERASVGAEIRTIAADPDVILRLEEDIYIIEEELKRSVRRAKVLNLLKDILKKAKWQAVSGVRKKLEEFMKEFIADITGGRYCELSLDDDLNIKVLSPEKKDFVIPEQSLSRGTIDQLYLVARFAFLEIISGTKKPKKTKEPVPGRPLIILDDPFHAFDSERRARAKKLLKRLSREFQIIFLTHSDEYDACGVVKTI